MNGPRGFGDASSAGSRSDAYVPRVPSASDLRAHAVARGGGGMRISEHLNTVGVDERLVCGCGCGMGSRREHWGDELVYLFECVRRIVGRPVIVSSGWRCPKYNGEVSLAELSQHAIGAALDLRCPPGMDYEDFFERVSVRTRDVTAGAGGVGRYRGHGFVHVDLGLGVHPCRRWDGEA